MLYRSGAIEFNLEKLNISGNVKRPLMGHNPQNFTLLGMILLYWRGKSKMANERHY